MKLVIIFTITLCGVVITSNAQDESLDSVFWVVETNIHQRNFAVVRLYNWQSELIQSITLNRYIDISKRKDRKIVQGVVEEYTGKAWASKKTKLKRSV